MLKLTEPKWLGLGSRTVTALPPVDRGSVLASASSVIWHKDSQFSADEKAHLKSLVNDNQFRGRLDE